MKNLTTKTKKVGIGIGFLILLLVPLKAQERTLRTKVGVTYTTTQVKEVSEGCLGIETLVENGLTKRFFAELELGLYTNKRNYSKMQANLGFKYNPILKDNWSVGIKTAVGVSNEVYEKTSPYEIKRVSEINSINRIIGLNIEKTFENKSGINFGISKDINKDIWRLGIKWIFKPDNIKPYKGFWR